MVVWIKVMLMAMKRMDECGIYFRDRMMRLDEWEHMNEVMREGRNQGEDVGLNNLQTEVTLWRWGGEQRWETGLNRVWIKNSWQALGSLVSPSRFLGICNEEMSWTRKILCILNLNCQYWASEEELKSHELQKESLKIMIKWWMTWVSRSYVT